MNRKTQSLHLMTGSHFESHFMSGNDSDKVNCIDDRAIDSYSFGARLVGYVFFPTYFKQKVVSLAVPPKA